MAAQTSAKARRKPYRPHNRSKPPAPEKPSAEPPVSRPKRGAHGRGQASTCEVIYTDIETIVLKAIASYQQEQKLRYMTVRDYLALFAARGWLNVEAITL